MHRHEQDPIKSAVMNAKRTGSLVLDDCVLLTLPALVYNAETLAEDSSTWYTSENIRKLSCRNCGLKSLSEDLSLLESLEVIDLSGNKLTVFPESLELPALRVINLSKNLLTKLDSTCFAEITELQASENRLDVVCFDSVSPMGALVKLTLAKNRIRTVISPRNFHNNLVYLDLSYNLLEEFDCAPFPNLDVLILHHNQLQDIRNISSLKKLRVLDLSYNRLQNDPHGYEFSSITGDIEILHDLRNKRIFSVLQEVNLSNNSLQSLPSFLFSCPELRSADLSNNNIQRAAGMVVWEFHESSKLESLDLTANDMQELPPELGTLKKLNKLRFDGNPMRRMRQIAGDNSCAKVLEYLRGKIPHDHPYYQNDKDSLSKQSRNKIAGQLKAMAEQQVQPDYTVLPNSSVVVRNASSSLSGCKLEFNDIHDIDEIPLSVLQTPHPSLNVLSSIAFRNCTCLTQNILQAILNNLNFEVAPSLRTLEITNLRKPAIQQLIIYRSSLTHITIRQLHTLVSLEISDNPFLSDVLVEDSGLEELTLMNVAALKSLSLKSNRLTTIPESVLTSLPSLEELYLNSNSISIIPVDIIHLKELQTLDLSCNTFKKLPNELGLLAPADEHEQAWTRSYAGNLTKLGLTGTYITHPPPNIVKRGALVMMRYMREGLNKDEFERTIAIYRKLDHAFYNNNRLIRSNSRQSKTRSQENMSKDKEAVEHADVEQEEVYNPYHVTDEMLAERERLSSRDSKRIKEPGGISINEQHSVPAYVPPRRGRVTQSSIQFGEEPNSAHRSVDYGRTGSVEKMKSPPQPKAAPPTGYSCNKSSFPSQINENQIVKEAEKPTRRHYLSSQGFW